MKKQLRIKGAILFVFVLLCSSFLFVACSDEDVSPENSKIQKVYVLSDQLLKNHHLIWRNNLEHHFGQTVSTGDLGDFAYNPLTGLPMPKEFMGRRPMVIQIDNFASARPQSGLSEADLVYEMLAEGSITRYMPVFYSEYPKVVGPIRSTRPYFIDKALEYDPYYIHVGGSMEGLSKVIKYQLADIDGLTSLAFYRVKHKKMPHNLYSTEELLLKEAKSKGYSDQSALAFLNFNQQNTPLIGEKAQEIQFIYRKPTKNDAIGYSSSYKYNSEENQYYRYTNNTPHLDERTKAHLKCSNILVQYVETKVIDNAGRLELQFIGSGKGRFYTSGSYVDVTWEKSDTKSLTLFKDMEGRAINLNPGKTWIQIMPIGNYEIIE